MENDYKSHEKKILNEIELSNTINETENYNLNYDLLIKENFINKLKRNTRKYFKLYLNYKYYINNTIIIILFLISYIKYRKSLFECKLESEVICLQKLGINYYVNLIFILIKSSFYLSIIYIFSIHKLIKFYVILIITLFYIINFLIYKGTNLMKHGTFNTLGLIIFTLFFILIIEYFLFWIKCLFNKRKKIFFILLIINILIFIGIKKLTHNDCSSWNFGLGNSQIIDDKLKDKCYIKRPPTCWGKKLNFMFDFSKILNINCENKRKDEKKILLKYIGNKYQNVSHFSFPLTSDFSLNPDSLHYNFQNKCIKNIKEYKNNNNNNEIPEVTLNFDENEIGTINISIIRNEKLIEDRKILYEENKNNIKFNNILMIYIDSISRRHFLETLPKTKQILEKYYYKNPKKQKKTNVFQFLKYQNFDGFTDINVFPMFYGSNYNTKGEHFINFYRKSGFITAQASNFCGREAFPYYYWNVNYIKNDFFDHELISLFCDPNFVYPEDPFSIFHGPYSSIRKCLYGKDSFDYIFEYGYKFLDAYQNEPKFLKLAFNDAHESTGNVIKYIDESLSEFINFYLKNYWNEKSMIYLVSDHGRQMPSLSYLFKDEEFQTNRVTGALFLFMPEDDISHYNRSGMYINEQRYITPYDIYDTLVDNLGEIYANKLNKKGCPLDIEIDGLKRGCDDYNDFLKDFNCNCINYQIVIE